jgi:hypothetical protein
MKRHGKYKINLVSQHIIATEFLIFGILFTVIIAVYNFKYWVFLVKAGLNHLTETKRVR